MFKQSSITLLLAMAMGLLTACGGTDYQPAAPQSEPVDLSAYAPAVDTFVVLLDTSGSMKDDESGRPKYEVAQDMVANFNSAIPEHAFNAGLVVFGKGAGTCMGDGVARQIYGMSTYNSADFAAALDSIDCVRSTTPIGDAVDITADALIEDTGEIAVVVFSDFLWKDPDAVTDGLTALKATHGDRLCLHTVSVGDNPGDSSIVTGINGDDCGTSKSAADVADPAAMTGFVADVLMSPIEYEAYNLSAMTLFDFDDDVLKEEGKAELRKVGAYIREQGIRVADIDVVGHTCSMGSQVYNAGLSERRAQSVTDFLVSEGVNPDIIDTSGMGELDPIDTNDTEAGRQRNRRVEVLVGAARPRGS